MATHDEHHERAEHQEVSQQRLRCFIAVTVGQGIKAPLAEAVAELQAVARADRLRLSWARPGGWHVTLKFLGDLTTDQVERIRGLLPAAVTANPALSVAARGLFTLPQRGAPRILAVGFEETRELGALASSVETVLTPLGFAREERAFVSHMTVARLRDPKASFRKGCWVRFGALVAAMRERGFGQDRIDTVGLYRSHLGPAGSTYERIADFPLASG